MELLKPDDPKTQLLKKSAEHRQQLTDEVKYMSDKTERVITNALVIGGTLAAAYLLVRLFTSGKKEKQTGAMNSKSNVAPQEVAATAVHEDSREPGVLAQIGTAMATQAAVFLLDLAKEKLSEYIQEQLGKKTEDHERD
jgi:hypothetical protein